MDHKEMHVRHFPGIISFVVFVVLLFACGVVHAEDTNIVPRAEINGSHIVAVGPGAFAIQQGGHGFSSGSVKVLVSALVEMSKANSELATRNAELAGNSAFLSNSVQPVAPASMPPIHPFWWVVLGVVVMLVAMFLYHLGRSSVPQSAPVLQPTSQTRQTVHSGTVTHMHRFEWDEFVRVMLRIIQSYFDHKIRYHRATHPTPPAGTAAN